MLEITFVRHGQVESNTRGAYIGWTNKPLNIEGINQAREAASKLANEKFEAIYTSPLERAKHTADLIKEKNGARMILDDGLKEWNFGIFDDLTSDAIADKYPSEYNKWRADWWGYKIPNGESAKDAYNRHSMAIKEIIAKYPGGGKILVVSHLCALRNMFAYLLGNDPGQAMRFSIKNASVSKIVITDDNYAVLTALNL